MDEKLPPIEFAFPGPLRDRLLDAIQSGLKTSTSSLLREYEVGDEPLPTVGGLRPREWCSFLGSERRIFDVKSHRGMVSE